MVVLGRGSASVECICRMSFEALINNIHIFHVDPGAVLVNC